MDDIEMTTVTATLLVRYQLPRNGLVRESLYGATEPYACVSIDLENDPGAFLADADDVTLQSVVTGPLR